MKISNPFADYGGIVEGERFVGRNREIIIIRNRLLGNSFGNIAIMGLPRIGKSSLAWKAIISIKEEIKKDKILPIWLSFGEYSVLNEVFEDLLFYIDEGLASDKIADLLKPTRQQFAKAETSLEKRRYIKRYLKIIRNNGWRIILILDEFDNAKNILNIQDFQFLREISYNLDTKIGLLTISRKTIQELEPDNGALSNFYQIFTDLRLKLFNSDDLVEYWNRIIKTNIDVTGNYIEKLKNYSGNHPFLLDIINNEVFNRIEPTEINLDATFEKSISELKLKIYNEYEAILKLISFEGLERTLIQMIVGPVYDINQRDVERLLKYSIVQKGTNGEYLSFSKFFNYYLNLKATEIDIWPLWGEVEKEIRKTIKHYLYITYGDDWSTAYINRGTLKEQKGKMEFISLKKDMMDKNIKSFGNKASPHLVDYTYPMDMFDRFIALDWPWFKAIFLKEKNDWRPIFEHLGKIRNPLAHNNPNFLSESDRNIAEGYCKLILEKIKDWDGYSV